MSIAALIHDLRGRGVALAADGGQLSLRAPKGVLTDQDRDLLARHKHEILRAVTDAADGSMPLPTKPEDRFAPFPLTDIQQAYWIGRSAGLELGNIGCHAYREFAAATLDVTRLEWAWQQLIQRHDMLLAVIGADGRQRVLADTPLYRIALTDLRGKDAAPRLEAIREEMSHRVFDPAVWPLFDIRAILVDDGIRIHIGMDLLIADAASMLLLFREWGAFYADPGYQPAPLQATFRDFVLNDRDPHNATAARQEAEAYWRARLPELPGAPELPFAKSPAAIASPHFVRRSHRLDPQCWSALRSRAAEHDLTPSALLCAAYAEVLAAWSRSSHFCVTLTMFNRPNLHPEIGAIVGDFTSTLLLEIDAAAAPDFLGRARRLQERLASDLEHGAVSGVRVLRELARHRGTATPAIPVVFTSALGYRGDDPAAAAATSWEAFGEVAYSTAQTPQVWIDHQASEHAGALMFTWDVVEALFAPGVTEAMFTAYVGLLRELAEDEAAWRRPVAALLPAAQRERHCAAEVASAPVASGLLHQPLLAQMAVSPDAPALFAGERRLSYRELDHLANGVAAALLAQGFDRGRPLGVVMDKGWEQAVAVLGILKAGGFYLPVDAALPPERRRQLLESGEVALALTQSDGPALPDGLPAVVVDRVAPLSAAPATMAARPDDLAYVIYTSGSTGQPKGVMIEHGAALNTVLDINRRFAVGPSDRVLALSSLSFDLSVYDLFGPSAAGGALVLPDAGFGRDPAHWASLVRRHQVTLWNSVPALMAMAVEHGAALGEQLRLVLLSGDWIALSLPPRIATVAPAARLVSLGGATEASIWSIFQPVERVEPDWRSVPYGRPLSGQSFHVLNDRNEPCADWVTGELHIGGAGLARGYWRDPGKTAARFITHPGSGERLYRTGDLGCWRSDGSIELIGRDDLQVKVQGHRIEPGEIEAALTAHPAVRDAVVIAAGDPRGDRRLAAFVVQHSPASAERAAPAAEAAWEDAVTAGTRTAAAIAIPVDADLFAPVRDQLTATYRSAAASAFARLGAFNRPGPPQTLDEVMKQTGIHPRYRHWVARALASLAEAGLLASDGHAVAAAVPLASEPPQLDAVAACDAFGFRADDFALLRRVVDELPDLLTDRRHAADVYTAKETPGIYALLFSDSYRILREVISAITARPDYGRILEVGGGLGAATRTVLPALPQAATFTFTDISPYFLRAAKQAFGQSSAFAAAVLDLERPPVEQEFAEQTFDVVLAASVLHATRDINESLRHLRQLLAPGGILLMLEETIFHPWYDLSMGLQPGFDRFEDLDRRRDHPLLDRSGWTDALQAAGFVRTATLGSRDSAVGLLGFDVMIAQAPARTPGIDIGELQRYLAEKLPAYMVPGRMMLLPALPLTANGKIDRNALERMEQATPGAASITAEPAGDNERVVAALWSELLPSPVVGRTESFFALGGNSITLVQAHARLEQRFGRSLPMAELFRSPTVAAIAALISAGPASSLPAGLVSFHDAPDLAAARPPLYMVPGLGGIPYYLDALAHELGDGRRLLAFLTPGLASDEVPDRIEPLAAHYLERLRTAQPSGPYLLAGHSFGGLVAFEMAQQLRLQGETVALLALLDTVVPGAGLAALDDDALAKEAMIRAIYALYGERMPVPYAALEPTDLDARLAMVSAALRSFLPAGTPLDGLMAVYRAGFRAMSAYRPTVYPGRLAVVRTELGFPAEFREYQDDAALADPGLGWTQWSTRSIDLVTVPGDHLGMMNPPCRPILARRLAALMDEAASQGSPGA